MRPDVMFTRSLLVESLVSRGTDVAVAWLLTYLVHSTVILLLAWVVTRNARVTETVREVVWKFAIVGGLLTASVQTAVAREPLGGQLRIASHMGPERVSVRVAMRDASVDASRRFILASPGRTRWSEPLVVLWLTGAGLGLLWMTFHHGRTLRALGDRSPLDDTAVRSRLDGLLARAGVAMPVTLTCSSAIASPVALPGNEICLPRRALFELAPNEQEGMLAHELAHLVRRDPQWLLIARVIQTVFFMQPLNRLARRRQQDVAEFLCDDWAVSRVSEPVTLAKCLAAVAEWVGRSPRSCVPRLHPMSAMVDSASAGSPLVRRVDRILSPRRVPRARTPRFTFAASACALIALSATAPRISVAHPAPRGGTMTVLRTTSTLAGGPIRDSVLVIRARSGFGIPMDSLVRRLPAAGPAGGAAAGMRRAGVVGRANVIVVERSPGR